MTITSILGAFAFIFAIAIVAAVFDAMRSREVIQPLILSDKNPEIIGDGAWEVPDEPAPPKTARVSDMLQQSMGV